MGDEGEASVEIRGKKRADSFKTNRKICEVIILPLGQFLGLGKRHSSMGGQRLGSWQKREQRESKQTF